MESKELSVNNSQFIIYENDGSTKLDVRFCSDDVWLTQKQIGELFDSSKANISEHIKNILNDGELNREATVRFFRTVGIEGQRTVAREIEYYNLDMIISLGYRINSKIATQFRIWATKRLHEYIQKGFVVDKERLKNPDVPFDYFEELEQIIQDIRTSERRFYLKITDIYATSVDYDKNAKITKMFFATVQKEAFGSTWLHLVTIKLKVLLFRNMSDRMVYITYGGYENE